MKNSIIRFIKGIGVIAVLHKKIISDVVDVLLFDFLAVDGNYYSLLVGYNDTEIFVSDSAITLLGDASDDNCLDLLLLRNLRRFSSKSEWNEGRYTDKDLQSFIVYCNSQLDKLNHSLVGQQFGSFRVIDTKVWLKPLYSIALYYSLNEREQKPLLLSINNHNWLASPYNGEQQEEFEEFLAQCSLLDLVTFINNSKEIDYDE